MSFLVFFFGMPLIFVWRDCCGQPFQRPLTKLEATQPTSARRCTIFSSAFLRVWYVLPSLSFLAFISRWRDTEVGLVSWVTRRVYTSALATRDRVLSDSWGRTESSSCSFSLLEHLRLDRTMRQWGGAARPLTCIGKCCSFLCDAPDSIARRVLTPFFYM